MDIGINEIVRRYAGRVKEQFNPKNIYLYGSHAKGTADEHSDIDIAVVIEPTDGKEFMNIFGKLFVVAADIDGRIEPNLLIDDGEDDKYSFLNEIKETGQLIYIN